ncbi:glycosyltransferase WbuB, partial [Coprococcus sp. AF21-14LB]
GGNLGKPQNIPFLLKIIEKLQNYSKAEFVIIGNGMLHLRL